MFQERINGDSEVANLRAGEENNQVGPVNTQSPGHFRPRRLHLHPEGIVGDGGLALITERDGHFYIHHGLDWAGLAEILL